jgi:hypothetical protein
MSVESFVHAGNTFSNDAFSRINNVCVHRGEESFIHLCFSLSYDHLFQSPMKFKNFRNTSQANAMKNCFTFFLDFCYSIGAAKSKEGGLGFDNIVCVLEACKHESKERFVGTRVHVFTTRCPSEMKKLQAFLDYNEEVFRKGRYGEFECHRVVNNAYAYASRICNVYADNTDGIASVDSMFVESESHKLSPSSVFSLQTMHMRNARYNDEMDYLCNGEIVFPDEDNILRISPDMLKPEILMDRYLVDYLRYRVNPPEAHLTHIDNRQYRLTFKKHSLRVDPPNLELVDDTCLVDLNDMDEFTSMLKNFRVLELTNTNEIHTSFGFFAYHSVISESDKVNNTSYMSMESVGDKVLYHPMLTSQACLSDIDLIKIRGDMLKGDMDEAKRKQFILNEFQQRCWGDTDANISKPLQSVQRWYNNDYNDETFKWEPHYNDVSVFGNRAIRIMKVYDKLFCISSAHHAMFLINHAKYDSWRHEMDLHFNVCSTGDGATSKSFLFDTMIETSIPGTCPEFTYETAKSNAHDDNNNHLRNVFQEAPQGMFTSNKHTDPQQEAAFKERLTSQKTSHRRLHIDEQTGVRTQVTSVSQAIGCYFGASNDPKSKSTPAMITRFHWLESEKVHREGRNIHDCQRANDNMDQVADSARARYVLYHKLEDSMMALTFQFIRIDLLERPDLSVADIVIDNFTILLKKYGIVYEGRTIERTKKLCTIMTIVNAKEQLFHTPGGKHCGKPFRIEQLLDMQDLMVCTEEIAIFCVGLMFNSIEAENHKKVLKAIWTLHQRSKEYRGSDSQTMEIDYSYIAVEGIKRLKQQIHGTIHESEGKIGESAIESVLEELRKSQIMCSMYEKKPGLFNDGHPEPTHAGKYRCERLIVGPLKTYVHMENFRVFREDTSSDLFKECLKELQHMHTPSHQILLGRRIRNHKGAVQHPHLFDTIMMHPTNQSLMVSGGTVYNEDDNDIIDVDSVSNMDDKMLDEDLDSYGRRQRSIKLGYNIEKFEQPTGSGNRKYPGNNLMTLFKKRKRVVKHNG